MLAPESNGGRFASLFNWPTLGFRYESDRVPPMRAAPALDSFGIAIPYWPVIIVLGFFEIRLLLRHQYRQAIAEVPPAEVYHGVIRSNLPCVHCSYDLHSLAADQRCPECGRRIEETLALSGKLSKSRPGWVRRLALGNIILFIARVLLVFVYASIFELNAGSPSEYCVAAIVLTAMNVAYLSGIALLTQREHPFLVAPEQGMRRRLRMLALLSSLAVTAGIFYQSYNSMNGTIPAGFFGVMQIQWDPLASTAMIIGWLIYCLCTIFEYHFLARLSSRLLDRFMAEHCRIAGIGAAVSSILVLFTLPYIATSYAIPSHIIGYTILVLVLLNWFLFLSWTCFMNLYCAWRFLQQSWTASARWREQAEIEAPQPAAQHANL